MHQCVRCGTIYEEANVILKGCAKCGCRLFYFFKEKPKAEISPIDPSQIKEIEAQIKHILGNTEIEAPIILDLETIRVVKPGKYEIDIVKLFKGHPLIFKIEDGKYIIDLSTTFQLRMKGK